MTATLTDAASEAWTLLVHPDQVCTPLVAVDWLVEQTGEETSKCVRALFNAAASWCESVVDSSNSNIYDYWNESCPLILNKLRSGSVNFDNEYGGHTSCALIRIEDKSQYTGYITEGLYDAWKPFTKRVRKTVEILNAITNSI